MKRQDAIRAGTQNATARQMGKTDWVTYITRVLAFIGLWQVVSNSAQFLTHWF
jgi:hypothetical protein